jgi:hypothetical protein
MRLSWNEVRARAAEFAREWQDAHYERGEAQSFYNDFVGGRYRRSLRGDAALAPRSLRAAGRYVPRPCRLRAQPDRGALFARDRTTVAHACLVVEDRRDDPELDGRLDHLERAVASLIDALAWHRGRR